MDRQVVTCRDGAGRLNAQWNAEIPARRVRSSGRQHLPGRAHRRAGPGRAAGGAAGLPHLPDRRLALGGGDHAPADGAERGPRRGRAVGGGGRQRGCTCAPTPEARAEAQTVSAYRAIGRQAETWVPLLRIVFECLYIGAFPMAVLLMLTPGRDRDIPVVCDRAGLAAIVGAALRGAAPHLHGGKRPNA